MSSFDALFNITIALYRDKVAEAWDFWIFMYEDQVWIHLSKMVLEEIFESTSMVLVKSDLFLK